MTICLVIDDNNVNREASKAQMKSLGFEVHSCVNGKEALEFCNHVYPEIILLDWHMPVMCGKGFLQNIKTTYDKNSKPFIILCSATKSESDINCAFKEGVDDSIEKPFNTEDMKQILVQHGFI
tara:strand:+ start:1781 stop:2149 length:369 start_codon:yes stop_codon:yes gene_type:complete